MWRGQNKNKAKSFFIFFRCLILGYHRTKMVNLALILSRTKWPLCHQNLLFSWYVVVDTWHTVYFCPMVTHSQIKKKLIQPWFCSAPLYIYIWILLYVAFSTIMAISRQKEARSQDYALLLFRMISRVLHSAQYHRQHCTLQAFEQFGALYICTATIKNIRPDRDSNLVPPDYKPQSIRMSHWGRPVMGLHPLYIVESFQWEVRL